MEELYQTHGGGGGLGLELQEHGDMVAGRREEERARAQEGMGGKVTLWVRQGRLTGPDSELETSQVYRTTHCNS